MLSTNPTRNIPVWPRAKRSARSVASWTCSRIRRVSSKNTFPAALILTPRGRRSNNLKPIARFRFLSRNHDLRQRLGLGAVKDEAQKMYSAFREAGGNFVDTANYYTKGRSESFLGEFVKGHRGSMVLATKYSSSSPGADPNAAGNQRKNMMQSVEAVLLNPGA
jgi:Aldo/keto reductase family